LHKFLCVYRPLSSVSRIYFRRHT